MLEGGCFCGHVLTALSEEVDVTTCSLDDPAALPPRDHTQVSSMISWVRLCDGLPAFSARRTP
jgi:hypothetical protein